MTNIFLAARSVETIQYIIQTAFMIAYEILRENYCGK